MTTIYPKPINKIQDEIIAAFQVLADDREATLHYLMELGEKMPPLADQYKTEHNRIRGCMSTVWLVHKAQNDRLFWEADSNTAITKGLISLLVRVFSGQTIPDILQTKLYFTDSIGMYQLIGSQRSSGFASMLKKIKEITQTYQTSAPPQTMTASPPSQNSQLKDQIIQALKQVHDPEIPVDIYELGLIYELNIDADSDVYILMTLTSPSCPAAELIPSQVESNVRAVEGINDVQVTLTFDPPYSADRMSEQAKLALGFL